MLGIGLLLWRKARPRTLLIWVLVFLVLPLLMRAFGAILNGSFEALVELFGRTARGGTP